MVFSGGCSVLLSPRSSDNIFSSIFSKHQLFVKERQEVVENEGGDYTNEIWSPWSSLQKSEKLTGLDW